MSRERESEGRVSHRKAQQGQALALMVVAMVAALAMVALIVDGGNAWAQQRITQNGSDAAANAGATVLGAKLANSVTDPCHGSTYPFNCWDTRVAQAVCTNADSNGITVQAVDNDCATTTALRAYYTDICGVPLTPSGTAATDITPQALETGTTDAARVGAGSLPFDNGGIEPDCVSATVGRVSGVLALGRNAFRTYFAPIVGIHSWTANTRATAVSGFLQAGATLPIAFNASIVYCNGQGDSVPTPINYNKNQLMVLPICKNGPGNVGFLDMSPSSNGVPAVIDCVNSPCNLGTGDPLPFWLYNVSPGDKSSKPLQDALNDHIGDIYLIPQFNGTCSADPVYPIDPADPYFGCPALNFGDMNGANSWYHISQIGAFQIEHAYLNGENTVECNPPWSDPPPADSKSTDCLIGTFVDFFSTGIVGPGMSTLGGSAVGVQLIK